MKLPMRRAAAIATAAAVAVTLAACGPSETTDAGAATGGGAAEDDKTITIGVHSGWDEGIAVSHLWQRILEDEGYDVELETADAGVVFTGLAEGDYDLNFDTWLPLTHASYMDEYGDKLEELGTWYDDAKLTIAVNEDAPIDSLAELADNADLFGNKLVGIEAGAGLTKTTQEQAIPTYGLEKMEYLISSTPAMLAELDGATKAGNNVAVTLWRPHWAYDAYPIKDLEDPEGAMGAAEEIKTMGTKGFAEANPDVAGWIKKFTLTDEQLFSLENIMFNEMDGKDNDAAVDQWLEENPYFVAGITG
ncbi:glycine betaine ABC transporter substrate-binding protein [Georgenia thermotolerans]|uniref:Glycine/betaine ABC transporter substrate-binding protein n=1 Tax=Georgenia thermotolerans TaxID=527326 RepID=A0A7J5URR3_9MICO|nr:glycine betaine ABC transporter substrate-binding protein [Georgenia thermotolerans]KAE8765068.1 glycine/betaine ABC transporter substrate-binding protein [Georgenia thermotolerans]